MPMLLWLLPPWPMLMPLLPTLPPPWLPLPTLLPLWPMPMLLWLLPPWPMLMPLLPTLLPPWLPTPLPPPTTSASPPWPMPKQSEENDQTYATHITRLHSEKKSDGTRCATSDGNKDFIDNLVYT